MELGQTVTIALLDPKSPLLVRTSVPKPKPKKADTYFKSSQNHISKAEMYLLIVWVIFVIKGPQAFIFPQEVQKQRKQLKTSLAKKGFRVQ